MKTRRLVLISGAVVALLLAAGIIAVTVALADEADPGSENLLGWFGRRIAGPGFGGRGFGFGDGNWTVYDTAASELGLTPEELFDELHSGESLEDIAEAADVDLQAVYDAMSAAARAGQEQAMQEAIEQALADGSISQEQADWLLQGLEEGYLPGRRGMGFGFGHGFGGHVHGGPGWGDCLGSESEQ